ncbi:MAG: carboxypeptidase regulatory-like domain-containing protein [Bacteroidetes bacterium]|nr:carboxypeptidase regulatory-like domain-containing protein [Bacteroidota bacterium]
MRLFANIVLIAILLTFLADYSLAQQSMLWEMSAQEQEKAARVANQRALFLKQHTGQPLSQGKGNRTPGDDCTQPYIISIPAELPFNQPGNTTCGHGNVYAMTNSCLGAYTGGEDFIYRLDVSQESMIDITMTPSSDWTGMALFDDCPDVGNCIEAVTYTSSGYQIKPMTIRQILQPGSYYVMIDSWPDPVCFDFDFSVTEFYAVYQFPFFAGFEDGSVPMELGISTAQESSAGTDTDASYNSDFGLMLEGGTAFGWGSTPLTPQMAFDPSRESHFAQVNIEVIPSGMPNDLYMSFFLKQGYSYTTNYCWFRVLINNEVIADMNGYTIFKPLSHLDPFKEHVFDLTPYQGSRFTITLQSSCKYYKNYFKQGDIVCIDDLRIGYQLPSGAVSGYVVDYDGQPVNAATVSIPDVATTKSLPDGSYILPSIASGNWTIQAWKYGYNPVSDTVLVLPADTSVKHFILTKPQPYVTPLSHEVLLNPNEYIIEQQIIANSGSGPFSWYATVSLDGSDNQNEHLLQQNRSDWLSLGRDSGTVMPFGGFDNIPVIFDATGLTSGTTEYGQIRFQPYQSNHIIVPCTLHVYGQPLIVPHSVVATLIDEQTGKTEVNWSAGELDYSYFNILRDGIFLGTSTQHSYTDFLPAYGEYCYSIQAVYPEGTTAPAGPACVLWARPQIDILPAVLVNSDFILPNQPVKVYTEIRNTGNARLDYEFPDFNKKATGDGYCTASGACGEYISRVRLGDIDNSSGCTQYGDYTNLVATLQYGNTYSLRIDVGSPFAGDVAGVWIDWDQDEDFSDETMLALSGTPFSGFTGQISPPAGALSGFTRMRIRLQWNSAPEPCGDLPFGEVEDYTLQVLGNFILSVDPSSGFVLPGQSQFVTVYFDGTGYPPGKYYQPLFCESNDPNQPVFIIHDTLIVIPPGSYAGLVTDAASQTGLSGVLISAGNRQTFSGPDGHYILHVNGGSYDVSFRKTGYTTASVENISALAGDTVQLDIVMHEYPNPPRWVEANPTLNYEACHVQWALPYGPYEIVYDDGQEEELVLWAQAGGENAVKFTPAGYPATVLGGMVFIGDGSFPAGEWMGSAFSVMLYDDDGPDGYPGTLLDEVTVTVENFDWVEFWELEATLAEGDFYLSMRQDQPHPAPPLGVDYSFPVAYRSYSRMPGDFWYFSPYQDFMIRAYVEGPSGDRVSSLTHYELGRISGFDPNAGPVTGTLEFLDDSITTLEYMDTAYHSLPAGWYAYAVRAVYPQGITSEWTYSNITGNRNASAMDVNVTLTTGAIPVNTEVLAYGENYPYNVYSCMTDSSGTCAFDSLIMGPYLLEVYKPGFEKLSQTIEITKDTLFEILLGENRYPPRNLYVDPLTSQATWDWPLHEALIEDFEGIEFPPVGWQSLTQGIGWFRTLNGSSGGWIIPPWDSHYVVSNADFSGSAFNACCDYLITPPLDLRDSESYVLVFDSFYDGAYGQLAKVEYSYDNGANWELFKALDPQPGKWSIVTLELTGICGPSAQSPIWIAFHADSQNQWASGWAIDNVAIHCGVANPQDFYVYLDGQKTGVTDTNNYSYPFLEYGREYEASVAARYTSGLSTKTFYTFISEYLIPPRNLDGITHSDTVELWWEPPLTAVYAERTAQAMREDQPDVYSDYSPVIHYVNHEIAPKRDQWDVQYSYPVAVGQGEVGMETDGLFLYTTKWNGNAFYKYDLQGVFQEEFIILGSGNIRDLAYNHNTGYMAGGAAGNKCFVMNFASHSLVTDFTAPTEIRAIAYDPEEDAYWANNWSSDITLFNESGAFIASFPVTAFGNFYGFAYDDWTDGGPYLWGFSQDNSGAVLVQMEIATGNQVFSLDVLPILGGVQIAGGLFTECNLIEDNRVTLGGTLQNELFFGLELGHCDYIPGPGGIVPPNFLGYNLYRDSLQLAWLPYLGADTTYYIDTALLPETYKYTVTGIYDLTPYGFSGDTAESAPEGPFIAVVEYGHSLPFKEAWYSGTFGENLWIQEENWFINILYGHPEPAAEFNWFPILSDYASSLTSWYIDGKNISAPFTDGCIWLDFDVQLNDRNMTGDEYLQVDVELEGQWYRVLELDNSAGGFDWQKYHLNISSLAFGKIFRIRFTASGRNSSDIESWRLDNIFVYRNCPPARNFTVEEIYTSTTVEAHLSWTPPKTCNGTSANSFALQQESNRILSNSRDSSLRKVTGYNLYRDSEFLTFTQDTFYVDVLNLPGVYLYELEAVFEDCVADTLPSVMVDIWAGIEDDLHDMISIYPVPASEFVHINSDFPLFRLTLLSSTGTIIYDQIPGSKESVLNVSEINSGLYLLKIYSGKGLLYRKLVVMH